jgi:DNA-binding helix-hairpin-helix protein with protein kinase domain
MALQVTFTDGTTELYIEEPFAQGAQARLHSSLDGRSVVKLYLAPDPGRQAALRKIIDEYNVTLVKDEATGVRQPDPQIKGLFAWPNAIVQKPGLGVRMERIGGAVNYKPLEWWLGSKSFRGVPEDMRGHWLNRTRVASSMARIAWKLHGSGLCHSDFSGDNFLTNVSRHLVVLIDLDNLVIPDIITPVILGTGEYMAPEIVTASARNDGSARPSIYTDLHALAVLIYKFLLMRHPLRGPKHHDSESERDEFMAMGPGALYIEDPDDTSNRPAREFVGAWALGEEVEALMRNAFTVGLKNPGKRSSAATWMEALLRIWDQAIPCSNPHCVGKYFVLLRDRPAVCPWCKTPVSFPKYVPVLRLYSMAGQKGHFLAEKGRIVGWQDRAIHLWHTQVGVSEPHVIREEERRPMAIIEYRRQWLLTNMGLPDLRVAGNGVVQQVAIGRSAPLADGQQWRFGDDETARLAVVNMQGIQ